MFQLWYCIFERKNPPHQHKDGWRKGFTFSIKYFSVIVVNIFLHKLYVFQFIDNGDKNNFVKLLQSEACNIPRFICLLWCHWPLFWTPGIEQTRFSPYRASVSSPLHNWGKTSVRFRWYSLSAKKKEEKVYACMNILKVFSYKGTWETIWTRWHSSSCKLIWTLSDNCLIIMMSRCVQRINFMEEMG